YNMLERGIESTVIPACEQCGLGIVVFSPLAQGVLTGKYLPGQAAPEGSRGADEKSNTFMDELQQPAVLERVQNLRVLAKSHGCELPEFALAWCLRQRQVSAVIVGATKVEQLEQNVKASDLELPDEAWQQADEILEGK
ncbi:MAG: aldo/keto reductase, partial [Fimbriimonas ginsengisoli]|nr:aldo/keto reductase [Fimbriimonas ginsengisoli]